MEWEGPFFDAPNHVPVWFDPRWVRARLRNARRKKPSVLHSMKNMAWKNFWTIFFDHFFGGGGVLREGWDAVYKY